LEGHVERVGFVAMFGRGLEEIVGYLFYLFAEMHFVLDVRAPL
jgi:hypothetical protein